MKVRRRCFVSGRVQGVCFRAYTAREAHRLGLEGFVRNLSDGRVEALVEGEEADVAALVAWLHRGSPHAKVSGVEVREEEVRDDLSPFSVEED